MLRVVLDANQFVSALLTRQGNSAKVLDLFRKDLIEIAISYDILEEMRRVLKYPKLKKRHGLSDPESALFLSELEKFCIVVRPPAREIPILKMDPSDDKYLGCAAASEADYVITGDKALLELGQYQGIEIITPKAFLEMEQV